MAREGPVLRGQGAAAAQQTPALGPGQQLGARGGPHFPRLCFGPDAAQGTRAPHSQARRR